MYVMLYTIQSYAGPSYIGTQPWILTWWYKFFTDKVVTRQPFLQTTLTCLSKVSDVYTVASTCALGHTIPSVMGHIIIVEQGLGLTPPVQIGALSCGKNENTPYSGKTEDRNLSFNSFCGMLTSRRCSLKQQQISPISSILHQNSEMKGAWAKCHKLWRRSIQITTPNLRAFIE